MNYYPSKGEKLISLKTKKRSKTFRLEESAIKEIVELQCKLDYSQSKIVEKSVNYLHRKIIIEEEI